MPQDTFETFIERERERFAKAREDALARKQKIEEELASIDRELLAITAYEDVKKGKLLTEAPTPRAPRARGGAASGRPCSRKYENIPTA